MRKRGSYADQITSDERHSRREQCGVEIVEHEVITRIITLNESSALTRSLPRLVVTDAINATHNFVSKRRSDLRELDNFLATVSHRHLRSE
ncbi:MAG: hypothetical protein ABI481_10090 [Pyrinomonadaceae bacterium]